MTPRKLASLDHPFDRRRERAPRAALFASLALALAAAACTNNQSLGALGGTGGNGAGGNGAGGNGTGGTSPTDGSPGDALTSCPAEPGPLFPASAGLACDGSFSCSYFNQTCCGFTVSLINCDCLSGHFQCVYNETCQTARCADASTDARTVSALIILAHSTNTPEVDVVVYSDGSAERTVLGNMTSLPAPVPAGSPRVYPAGSPEVMAFLSDLSASGDLAAIGDPAPVFWSESCPKSASFGTTTKVTVGGVTSGDVQCLINPTAAQTALSHDCDVLTGNDPVFLSTASQCFLTAMGRVSASICCAGTGDFPDTCNVGACGCSSASSHSVNTCLCPGGGCFSAANNSCAGPAGTCTVGQDQTCNDNPAISSLHGHCITGGRCLCGGFGLASSGKCL